MMEKLKNITTYFYVCPQLSWSNITIRCADNLAINLLPLAIISLLNLY